MLEDWISPEYWVVAMVITIYKKNIEMCENYRGICLLYAADKLCAKTFQEE
jgi:hypothetical protein